MNANLRNVVQEAFADCTSIKEVCELYKELSMETKKQMELMIDNMED